MIKFYTDGACSCNPGPGGWSVVATNGEKVKIFSGHEVDTTNNRMELTAVLKALEYSLERGFSNIEIYSDSSYVVNAINLGWLCKWRLNNWINSSKDPIKNVDIWKKIIEYMSKIEVKFFKVKGHDKIPLNEMADKRAVEESMKAKFLAEAKK